MQCSLPPPLDDDQLDAALDGKADPGVLKHLAQCSECTARLSEARKVEQMLASVLYRWDCPTAEQLGNHHLQLISAAESTAIRLHLDQCAHCQAELAEMRVFLAAERLPKSVTPPARAPRPRLGDMLGRLMPQTPQFALRGAASGPIVTQAGDISIFLELLGSPNEAVLTGQLVAEEIEPWIGALVMAHQDGEFQVTSVVDDMGTFRCGPLRKAPIDIRITIPAGNSIFLNNMHLSP